MARVPRIAYLCAAEAWYAARAWLPEVRRQRLNQRRLYGELIGRGDLCFDVGAHIGDRTRRFLELGARVIAVEPQPSCIERLEHVFAQDPRVIVVREAVGSAPGQGTLAICEAAPTISSMSVDFRESGRFAGQYEWTRTVTVPMTTLDLLIERYGRPTFCKIDVEGFELEVLRGLTRSVPCLSFEFGWDTIDQTRLCLEHLAHLGAISVNYSVGESMAWAMPAWMSPDSLLMHLETLRASERIGGDIYVRTAKN